jgi:hypothetical protein
MAELAFNAHASLRVRRRRGQVTAVTTTAPVRGRPLRSVVFSREDAPGICAFLAQVAERAGDVDAELDNAEIASLADAGLLVPEELDPGPRPRLRCDDDDLPERLDVAARTETAAAFGRDRYTVVRGLVDPAPLAGLRSYYRALVAGGWVRLGDGQVPVRYRAHDEPAARWVQRRLAGLVAGIAGEPLKPSYAYFVSYLAGAVLPPHRDRAQCAVSVSLLVDHTPEPGGASPWPLWLEAPGGRAVPVALGPGDGLVYRGTELRHWREALPEGHTQTSLLLHYVPAGFRGPLD